ncbi:unnamed protein product [Echinostoma caproni]|uniref:Uncharacterized protein n=1 Tax=Echinostoma caproni TaxID=27848 RepID=A0A183BD22_9TREM|nr:unnamed protein product [Echinostoma caproni]
MRWRRLQWIDPIIPRSDNDLTKAALAPPPCRNWHCLYGEKLKTWLDPMRKDTENLSLPMEVKLDHNLP